MKQPLIRQSLPNAVNQGFKRGTSNPQFKDGRTKKTGTCECGKQLKEYRAKRCLSCYRKWMAKHNVGFPNRANNPNPKRGPEHSQWRGDDIGYKGMHQWLNKVYGKASKCENKDCNGQSKWFEWAKRPDSIYERKRENFMQLCRSCHRIMDIKTRKNL